MNFRLLLSVIIIALFAGCTKEEFNVNRNKDTSTANPIEYSTNNACSSFTLIKPEVDFLFLWDNSSSTVFINDQTKAALNNTIDLISNRFDYHIMMAPLIGTGNSYAKFISDTPNGLGSSALAIKVDRTQAAASLANFPKESGNYEAGVQRSIDLISNNQSNGIFRQNAYLIVVVMSNQDDNSWVNGAYPTSTDRNNYVNAKVQELLCLRGNSSGCGAGLNNLQMRFFSIVAHTDACGGSQPQWEANRVYKEVSSRIYSAPYTNGNPTPTDQGNPAPHPDGIVPYDTYDICSEASFVNIFNGINNSIQDTLIKHKYNYWPVATSGAKPIDANEVKVYKDGVEQAMLQEPVTGSANGFTFANSVQTVNTRYEPTSGESFSGYVVKLYGNSRVTYPECMTVTTQTPKEYFGYVALGGKPVESSIVLKINGVLIPQGGANGWELIKSGGVPQFFNSKNIKITGATNFCPSNSTTFCEATPGIYKSGYFLKMNGSSVYSNGANIDVTYDPSN